MSMPGVFSHNNGMYACLRLSFNDKFAICNRSVDYQFITDKKYDTKDNTYILTNPSHQDMPKTIYCIDGGAVVDFSEPPPYLICSTKEIKNIQNTIEGRYFNENIDTTVLVLVLICIYYLKNRY